MKFIITWALVALAFAFFPNAFAAVERRDNISATVTAAVSLDNNTGLYTYRYTITNYGESPKLLDEFYIPLRGATVLNIVAPAGWEGSVNRSQTLIGWCACREDGFVPPPGYVNDGRGIPSNFAVMPGGTLSGFSFQSAFPPSSGIFYAGGWVPIPVEGVDFPEGQEPVSLDFPMNLLSGSVSGPLKSETIFLGGRRPAVDGFLVFVNFRGGESYASPVIVDILFSQNGETVQQSTFKALLNGVDVTGSFIVMDANRRRAVFEANSSSPLKIGKNTLDTSVEGTVPGATNKATDTERVVFVAR